MFTAIIIIFLTFGGYSTPSDLYKTTFISQDDVIDILSTKESECLAKALYFEARGESEEGINYVAKVILNRKDSDLYPDSICGVVNQKGQFTYDHSLKPKDDKVYNRMKSIAITNIMKYRYNDGIMYYHNITVKPEWTKRMVMVTKIDNHIFYKRKS